MRCFGWLILFLYSITITFFISSCHTTEPEKQKLEIAFEDVSCTEAWLNVKGETGSQIILNRDGKEVQRFTLNSSPQTVYDDSLLPNKSYDYQLIKNGEASGKVTVTTLDTTGNSFTWKTWIIGDGLKGFSALYDCAVISENDIWAVGEINIADSSANGYTTYNAVHWNGNNWDLKKITVEFRGSKITLPLDGIFAFSSNDIWVVGSLPIHGDGNNWIVYDLRITVDQNLSVSKAWGINSDNMYFVGLNGSIAHYQNGQWSKIETGTEFQFVDIFGVENKITGKQEILTVCTSEFPLDRGIYMIEGNTAKEVSSKPIKWELSSIWFTPNRHYYLAGDGIYEKTSLADSSWKNEPLDITRYSTTRIRGNNVNDVFVSGAFGEILHFNGLRWKSFMEQTGWFDGAYGSLAVKGDIVVAVGGEGQLAKIIVGKRD